MSRKPNTIQPLILQGLQQQRPFFLLCRVISVNPKKLDFLKIAVTLDFTRVTATMPVFLIMYSNKRIKQ